MDWSSIDSIEDWRDFIAERGLCRKGGVPQTLLQTLIIKELVDNALDAGGVVSYGLLSGGGFFVHDLGGGIRGTPEDIARLFSVRRPRMSSKLLRRVTRGMLGHGLRIVVGYLTVVGGTIVVMTCGMRIRLRPLDNGTTEVVSVEKLDGAGTRIELWLGGGNAFDELSLEWGEQAVLLASGGPHYSGNPSVWWYDTESFRELCLAKASASVLALVSAFDGFSRKKAAIVAAEYRGRKAGDLSREEAERLLLDCRALAKPVSHRRLGYVGRIDGLPKGYCRTTHTLTMSTSSGNVSAQVPVVIEVWADLAEHSDIFVHVNRTPVVEDVSIDYFRHKGKGIVTIRGCGFADEYVAVGQRAVVLWVNVEAPTIELTSDGKAPNLRPLKAPLFHAIRKAVNSAKDRARKAGSKSPSESQKDYIVRMLPSLVKQAQAGRNLPYGPRRLYYCIRPAFIQAFGGPPNWNYFSQVITDYENELGHDLPGIRRDARGKLYHPHTKEEIPLGTAEVERYKRPEFLFHRVLYCEKEGLLPAIIEAKIPERFDCAVMTSKGYASRAARDLMDLLGEGDEEITIFVVHDCDGYGTKIAESIIEETKARPARRVRVIDFGLHPEEAHAMGLPEEPVERKGGKRVPVAKGVLAKWRRWYQHSRIELDSMDAFIEWLVEKLEAYPPRKVIPDTGVLTEQLNVEVETLLAERIRDSVLKEAGYQERVVEALQALEPAVLEGEGSIQPRVYRELERNPVDRWVGPVRRLAGEIVEAGGFRDEEDPDLGNDGGDGGDAK